MFHKRDNNNQDLYLMYIFKILFSWLFQKGAFSEKAGQKHTSVGYARWLFQKKPAKTHGAFSEKAGQRLFKKKPGIAPKSLERLRSSVTKRSVRDAYVYIH